MFTQTIRTNILTIFLLLLGTISISLLTSQYYFSHKLAEASTKKTFKLIASNISAHIQRGNEDIFTILKLYSDNTDLNQRISFNAQHPVLAHFTQIIEFNSRIYSVYVTQEDGSYYELVNMKESQDLYRLFKAPKETRWTNIISINNRTQYSFFDKNKKIISSYFMDKKFNPKERLWYKMAMDSNKSIITPAYNFTYLNKPGISYATKLKSTDAVFGLDYTLQKLHTFLKLQKFEKNSEVFLFNDTNDIVVSSNNTERPEHKRIDEALKMALKIQQNKIIKYSLNSENYFSFYSKVGDNNLFLGIKVITKHLYAPYIQSIQYSFTLSLLLLLLALPIILFAVKLIVKPIKALIIQN